VQRVDLGEAAPIDQAVEAWRAAIAARQASPAAAALRKLLWQPVAALLPADVETVYLAPDGPLALLPWAALPGRQPGTVLLEDHAVAVVPNGRILLEQLLARPKQAPAASAAAGGMLAVGGVAYGNAPATPKDAGPPERFGRRGPWQPLPGTAQEVARLRAGATARVLEGGDARTARLAAELPQARLTHLATYGFCDEAMLADERRLEREQLRGWKFDPNRPGLLARDGARSPLALSGLVLAGANRVGADDPGILTGEALVGLPLEGLELAVLSACQTGQGDDADRACMTNLQLAFHLAGSRNVVTSLWSIPDQAKAALLAVFYDELLRKKKPPLEALRQAQLALYRNPGAMAELAERGSGALKKAPPASGSARAATMDWAGFVLSGLGR
jgi:CHAT domain-containing protein